MFTICPKCALTLLVTAEDLRVAQGYVRCGRCSSVFNALARLTEERQTSEGAPDTATSPPRESSRETSARQGPPPPASRPTESRQGGAPPPPPEGMSDEDSIPEHALEFDPTRTDVSTVFVEPAPSAQWSAATGSFKAMMAANQEAVHAPEEMADASPPEPPAGAKRKKQKEPSPSPPPPAPPPPHASSAAQDDDADIDVEIGTEQLASILRAELAPVPPAAPSPAAAGAASAPPSSTGAAKAPTQPPPPRPRAPSTTARPRAKAIEPPGADFAPPPPPPPAAAPPAAWAHAAAPQKPTEDAPPHSYAQVLRVMRPREGSQLVHFLWGAGAVVMLLVLLAQVVNHHRDELAASARFNRPLTALYAALGVRLEPRWDLKAYDVRQLGASVESGGPGLITVRASVKNGAAQPLPLPLLRVTLQDRFGNRIAARDVAPRFYLSGSAPPFLLAGERVDAEMGFVDPGANAVGFEIDACLPASGGVITCANDNAAR